MVFKIILLLTIIVITVICFRMYKKGDYKKENFRRCDSKNGYVESAEEIIRKEKVTKIIRYAICYGFLGIMAIFMILPFYWMVITSLKTQPEIELYNPTFFPTMGFEWDNYKYVLSTAFQKANNNGKVSFDVLRLMYNTLVVGVVSTIGTVVTTVLAAFAFSRIKFIGRETLFTIFLATMMIPGEMMVISNYITVIGKMNGTNTYWAMIVPFLISVYYIYLLRQNFRQIPDELYYAAKVDGTSDIKYLMKIMVPIAMPTLITITILKLSGSWNAYVWPEMVTRETGNAEETMKLISNGLRTSFSDSEGRSAQGKQMAAATVVLAPLLVMFVCLRKYIMRGVSRSGIKG